MTRRSVRLSVVMFAGLLALGACAGAPATPTATPPPPLRIEGSDFRFDPATPSVAAGEITVELVNVGALEHDFTINELNVYIHADVAQTTQGTFTASAGTYTFYCAVPGHLEAGMEGTLTVR